MFANSNENNLKIQIGTLLVLCEIAEDYKSFCNDLEKLIKSKHNKDLVTKLYHITQGKSFIGSRKYKKFMLKHMRTIEIMKKHYSYCNFTVLNYDEKGNRRKNLPEDYFYQYIQNHKEDIETIKAVVLKIRDLGFNEITLKEGLDFTKYEYDLDTKSFKDFAILENMEVNLPYLPNPITYKTNNSCYCIMVGSHYKITPDGKKINNYGKDIILNTLVFDPDKLPTKISTETTFDVIKKLFEESKEKTKDIRQYIDLSITITYLNNYLKRLKYITANIDKIKDDQKLNILLDEMQNILIQLYSFGIDVEHEVIESHQNITRETLQMQKKLYLNETDNK